MKLLLTAAHGKVQNKIPLWFMRQAGRYLPEYREIRKTYDTLTMFKTPHIASEITLQPLRRFNLDGAILYADILLIPDALGVGLQFVTGEGPKISHTIRSAADLTTLKDVDNIPKLIERLSYVGETLSRVKQKLDDHITMLGFAGAPFTVASYMIEGGSGSKNQFNETKTLIANEPATFHTLMDILTNITIAYLHMQIQCGAEVLQLFESWSGVLNATEYSEFCLPYVSKIVQAIKPHVPVILYLGTSKHLLDQVLALEPSSLPNVLSVDHHVQLSDVSQKIQMQNQKYNSVHNSNDKKIALQGNLDPNLLFASKQEIDHAVTACLDAGHKHPYGYIFNLGHGINQHTPIQNVEHVIKLVKGNN